ncbi:MAG: histidine kinase [Bacteroidota bacterium]
MSHPFITIFFRYTWIRHSLFWAVSIYTLGHLFAASAETSFLDYLYSGMVHLSVLPLVYLNLRVLVPKLFSQERYGLYLLACAMNVLLAFGIHTISFQYLVPQLAHWSYYMVDFIPQVSLLFLFAIYLGISTLLSLSKSWWIKQQLEKENLQLSFKALQSQINPHFLFNSLHSLYALALKNSPQTPDLLLNLSEMLRYMLYRTSAQKVPLSEEVEYLHHYVAFQKLRTEEHVDIQWEVELENPSMIAPLLLVPLVENAFKHGVGPEASFVHLKLVCQENQLVFTGKNSRWPELAKSSPKESSGIGMENVRQRIQLMYPNQHQLEVNQTETEFHISLSLTLH